MTATAERPSSLALRRQWEAGERGAAIRGAIEHWDALLASGEDVQWLERALRSVGLPAESANVQVHIARQTPNDAAVWERLVASTLHSDDPWWARDLLAECPMRTRRLQELQVEIDLQLGDAAASIASWQREHRDAAALESAVRWWIAGKRVDEAERLIAATDVNDPRLTPWRARLALWRGQTQAARAIVATLPSSAETRIIAAAAAVLDGSLEEAERQLRELVDGDTRGEAWSWLATVLRKQGRYAEAKDAADCANKATPGLAPAARFERELASEYECVGADTPSRTPLAWLRRRFGRPPGRVIGDLDYAPLLYALGLRASDPLGKLEIAIERLSGNRSPYPTVCESGVLRSVDLPIDPRHLGARLQVVLWTRGLEALRTLYREIGPRVQHHPLFEIYRGEVELWVGEYAEAERIFRAVLARDRKTLWAWIGLGGAVMLQGDYAQAQAIWAEGVEVTDFEGPTLFVLRGECWRRQGERDRARRDLERAVRDKPQRLSAHINLALVDQSAERLDDALRRCEAFAPLLMEELSGPPSERLEGVLAAMGGNRSSSPWLMSYRLWGRVWCRAN